MSKEFSEAFQVSNTRANVKKRKNLKKMTVRLNRKAAKLHIDDNVQKKLDPWWII